MRLSAVSYPTALCRVSGSGRPAAESVYGCTCEMPYWSRKRVYVLREAWTRVRVYLYVYTAVPVAPGLGVLGSLLWKRSRIMSRMRAHARSEQIHIAI